MARRFYHTFRAILALLSSYGLACVLFVLLLLLTYLGTLYQVEHGIYAAQQKYFYSALVVHFVAGAIPIILPGAYLVLALLFINILLGGIVRIRKGWRQAGVLLTHAGILLLLAGGFFAHHYAIDGRMNLYEGESTGEFESLYEWEVAILPMEPGAARYTVPQATFQDLSDGENHTLGLDDATTVALNGFVSNSELRPAYSGTGNKPVVEGRYLAPLPHADDALRNTPGLLATVSHADGESQMHILWGGEETPVTVQAGDRSWQLHLRKRQWHLPFTLTLDAFHRERHPGTDLPRMFTSELTKTEAGIRQPVKISMNQPLRHKGYTIYQASWGPQDAPPGTPVFSTFAVSRNPADQFPLYACIVLAAGMLIQFSLSLRNYLVRQLGGVS